MNAAEGADGKFCLRLAQRAFQDARQHGLQAFVGYRRHIGVLGTGKSGKGMEAHPHPKCPGFLHAFLQGSVSLGKLFAPQYEMSPGFKGFRVIQAGKTAHLGIRKHFIHVFGPKFPDEIGTAGFS